MGNRSDNFTRANSSTSLGTPSDGGSAWVAQSGTWGITSNHGYNVDGGSQETAVLDSSLSDGTVSVTWATFDTGSGNNGFIFRASDDNNYWLVTVGTSGAQLFKRVAGGFNSVVGPLGGAPSNGDSYAAVLSGNSIQIQHNGANISGLSASDAFNVTASKHGLRANGVTTTQQFSAFSFTAPPATAFSLTGSATASVGLTDVLMAAPNGPVASTETVAVKDDLGTTLATLTFNAGSSAGQVINWAPTLAEVGARTITATPSPALGTPPTLSVTVYNLTLLPATQSVTGGAAASLTATLTGGAGAISATSSIGALSTATPASGTPFTETPPNATGTATVTVTGPGGATASATVAYTVGAGLVPLTTTQQFPVQYAGLRGTVGFTVYHADGTLYLARDAADVSELAAGSADYLGVFAGVPGQTYYAVWDTGGASPLRGGPDVLAAPVSLTGSLGQIVTALAGATMQVVSPVGSGLVVIQRGKAYRAAYNNPIDFTPPPNATWPADLTGWTITFGAAKSETNPNQGDAAEAWPMSIVTASGAGQKIRLELTTAQTSNVAPGQNESSYTFTVVATPPASSDVVPLLAGLMPVLS